MDSPPPIRSAWGDVVSSPKWRLAFLLAVAACLFAFKLGSLPLREPDEGRNAEVAREMLAGHDWITPHFDSLPYLDKPALFFWLVAGSFRLGGVSEGAARLPSALAALGTAFLVWLLARRMFDDSTALAAGLVWATTPLAIIFARTVIFDMPLTFLVTAAFVCFWFAQGRESGRTWLDAGFFAAMGIATSLKGPVGFLIPLLSIVAYQVLRGRGRDLKRIHWGLGLLVFLSTAAPWYVIVSIRHPDYFGYAFWQETLLRYTTSHMQRRGGFFYYLPVFFGGFLPWSLFLVFAGLNHLKQWRLLLDDARRAELFLLTSAAVIFVFFSIGRSKLPGYVLPALAPLSILVGRAWGEAGGSAPGRQRPDWLTAGFAALLLAGILVAASPQLFHLSSFQALARRKLPPVLVPLIRASLFSSGVILAALGVLGRSLARRRPAISLVATFALAALAMPLLAVRWAGPLGVYDASDSSRQLAQTILASPQRELPVFGYYYFRTSLPFYLRRPVGLVTAGGSETTSNYVASRWQELHRSSPLLSSPAAAADGGSPGLPVLVEAGEIRALAGTRAAPLLIVARNDHLDELARLFGSIEPEWTAWDYSVAEAAGARPKPGEAERPAVMIDKVIER